MGDYYLVNGTKNWITNGNSASTFIVMAQTNIEAGHRGINALILEKVCQVLPWVLKKIN